VAAAVAAATHALPALSSPLPLGAELSRRRHSRMLPHDDPLPMVSASIPPPLPARRRWLSTKTQMQ
jgi:hypothetical protein